MKDAGTDHVSPTLPFGGPLAIALSEAPPSLLPDPLASSDGGSGQDAALRGLKIKRGGPRPEGSLAALLGPDPRQPRMGTSGAQ